MTAFTLRTRIIFVFSLVSMLAIALCWQIYRSARDINASISSQINEDFTTSQQLLNLRTELTEYERLLYEYYATMDRERIMANLGPLTDRIGGHLEKLQRSLPNDHEELADLRLVYARLRHEGEKLDGIMSQQRVDWDAARATLKMLSEYGRQITPAMDHLFSAMNRQRDQNRRQIHNRLQYMTWLVFAFVLASLGTALALAYSNRQALRADAERRRLALFPERSPTPVIALSEQGQVQYKNPASKQLAANIDASQPCILPPDIKQRIHNMRQAGQQTTTFEYDIKGHTLHARLHALTELRRYHLYANDITEYKAAETARNELLESLQNITRHIPGMIYQYRLRADGSSHFPYTSAGIENIYGVRPEDVAEDATVVFAALHEDDVERVREAIHQSAATLSPWHDEYRVNLPDGRIIWVEGNATPHAEADGSILWHGYITDITERKQVEAERQARAAAEQANAAKSQFLSTMSHELRTPLNAILGFTQLLDMEIGGGNGHESIAEITSASHHLLNLVNDILELSRLEAGQVDLHIEAVAITPLIRECLTLVTSQANTAGITLAQDADDCADAAVAADRTRLKQALLNYLTNAIKYNRADGHVNIGVERSPRPGYWRIVVSDTGEGLSEEQQAHIFDPFTRLPEHIEHQIEGTGIGLTITRRLVELMHGRVGVDSERGVGSRFWLELPLTETGTKDSGISRTMTTDSPNSGDNEAIILYIEDNPANLRLVQQSLARENDLTLYTAMTPAAGLEQARRVQPDVILLDLNLHGIDGYSVLHELQAEQALAVTPVIAVTAQAMPWDIEKGQQSGFFAYLTKPIDLMELVRTIRMAIAQTRQ